MVFYTTFYHKTWFQWYSVFMINYLMIGIHYVRFFLNTIYWEGKLRIHFFLSIHNANAFAARNLT